MSCHSVVIVCVSRALVELLRGQEVQWVAASSFRNRIEDSYFPTMVEGSHSNVLNEDIVWTPYDTSAHGLPEGSYTVIEEPLGVRYHEWVYLRMNHLLGGINSTMRIINPSTNMFDFNCDIVFRFRNPPCNMELNVHGTWDNLHLHHLCHLFARDNTLFRIIRYQENRGHVARYLLTHNLYGNAWFNKKEIFGVLSTLKDNMVWHQRGDTNEYPMVALYFFMVVAPNMQLIAAEVDRLRHKVAHWSQLTECHGSLCTAVLADKDEFANKLSKWVMDVLSVSHLSAIRSHHPRFPNHVFEQPYDNLSPTGGDLFGSEIVVSSEGDVDMQPGNVVGERAVDGASTSGDQTSQSNEGPNNDGMDFSSASVLLACCMLHMPLTHGVHQVAKLKLFSMGLFSSGHLSGNCKH